MAVFKDSEFKRTLCGSTWDTLKGDKNAFQRWIKGATGSTCDTTCGAVGLICDSDAQTRLNTNDKVKAAFAEAGYTCKSFHSGSSYPGSPFSTGRDNDDCSPFKVGKHPSFKSSFASVCGSNQISVHAPLCSCRSSKGRLGCCPANTFMSSPEYSTDGSEIIITASIGYFGTSYGQQPTCLHVDTALSTSMSFCFHPGYNNKPLGAVRINSAPNIDIGWTPAASKYHKFEITMRKLSDTHTFKIVDEDGVRTWSKDFSVPYLVKPSVVVIPYRIPLATDGWCGHPGAIHQDVPGCGRVCSDTNSRGVKKLVGSENWPSAPCSACPGAEWASCVIRYSSIRISALDTATASQSQSLTEGGSAEVNVKGLHKAKSLIIETEVNLFVEAKSCSACPAGELPYSSVLNDDTSCQKLCPSTQVPNSDKAATNSISGVMDASVTVTCDSGWSGTGATVCGKELQWKPVRFCSVNSCIPTQVANSDKSEAKSITGKACNILIYPVDLQIF